jgi:hypothetical protein
MENRKESTWEFAWKDVELCVRIRHIAPRIATLEHDPEKHALGPRPDGWLPVFPRDKREAFARRSCSNKKIERDDDSKKSHRALGRFHHS